MKKLLDRIFIYRKAAVIAPLATAAVMYLLYLLFGQGEDKQVYCIVVPVISAIFYWAFCWLWGQYEKIFSRPDWLLDAVKLLILAVFGFDAVKFGVQFLMNMAQNFSPLLCPAIIIWSAVAFVHCKRK